MGDATVSHTRIYVDLSKLIFQLTNGTVILKRLPNTWLQKSLSTTHIDSTNDNYVEDKENNSKVYTQQIKKSNKAIKNVCDYRIIRRKGGGSLKELMSAYCPNCDNKLVGVNRASATCDKCNNKFRMFLCGICNSNYGSMKSLKTHIYKMCNPVKSYFCNHCNYECYRSSEMMMHVIRHQLSSNPQHPELKLYKEPIRCDLCPFTSTYKSSLLNHLKAKHPETVAVPLIEVEEKPIKCLKCGKIFTNRNGLGEHSEFCQKPPTIPCQFCPHRTYRPAMMKKHLKKVHAIFVEVEKGGKNDQTEKEERKKEHVVKKRKREIEEDLPYTITRIKIDSKLMMKRSCMDCKKPQCESRRGSICFFCKGTLLYACTKCGLTLPNYSKMKDHVRVTCFGKTLFHCRKCGCSRTSREFILNHISKSHNADEM